MADLQEIKSLIKQHSNQYYTYLLKRPNGIPFYVGKGNCKGFRIEEHIKEALSDKLSRNPHKVNLIRKIIKNGKQIDYEIIGFFDNEQSAFRSEIKTIRNYGRKNTGTGILTNLTDGGEGRSGCTHIVSEEARIKISKLLIGNIPWNKGKVNTIQKGQKAWNAGKTGCSCGNKKGFVPWNTGKGRSGMTGKNHSEETRKKISESKRGVSTMTEDGKRRLSEFRKQYCKERREQNART